MIVTFLSRMTKPASDAGDTLIEVIISALLTGLIVVAVFTGLNEFDQSLAGRARAQPGLGARRPIPGAVAQRSREHAQRAGGHPARIQPDGRGHDLQNQAVRWIRQRIRRHRQLQRHQQHDRNIEEHRGHLVGGLARAGSGQTGARDPVERRHPSRRLGTGGRTSPISAAPKQASRACRCSRTARKRQREKRAA